MTIIYHELYSAQFEKLVIFLCQELLGIGVQGFCDGKDGGRDARFHGTAENYPSKSDPWSGHIIIQAKHTTFINQKFSDEKFRNILDDEIPSIKSLVEEDSLSGYMLFSNRRLSALEDKKIRDKIETQAGVPHGRVAIIGEDQLNDWIKRYPNIHAMCGLNLFQKPLSVDPMELADLIVGFNDALSSNNNIIKKDKKYIILDMNKKNKLNSISESFFKQIKRYSSEFPAIEHFLKNEMNIEYRRMYEDAADEFNLKMTSYSKDFDTFDDFFTYLYDFLINRDNDIKTNKKLSKAFLAFMYFQCDLGHLE